VKEQRGLSGTQALSVVPLSPIQRWFFAQSPVEPSSYSQAHLLEVPDGTDVQRLGLVLQRVVARHDALGMRYAHRGGRWVQWHDESIDVPVEHVKLSLPEDGFIAEITARTRGRLNLTSGPLLAAALIERPAARPLMVLIVHHLAVDAVSWTLLLDDLRVLLHDPAAASDQLPPQTTSYADWCKAISDAAEHWGAVASRDRLQTVGPRDALVVPAPAMIRSSSDTSLNGFRGSLGEDATTALLAVAARSRVRIDHLLLAALGTSLSRAVDGNFVAVDVETHGRGEVIKGIDLIRSVGWFTAIRPAIVSTQPDSLIDEARRLGDLSGVASQDDVIYFATRWLQPDSAPANETAPAVLYTYLGRTVTFDNEGMPTWAPAPDDNNRTTFQSSPYVLTVNVWVRDDELGVDWWTPGWLVSEELSTAHADYLDQLRSLTSVEPGAPRLAPTDLLADALTATETVVHEAWTTVLDSTAPWNGHRRNPGTAIGPQDDFFEVGGDSIHMIQVASRLRRAFGLRVPLRVIYDHPTVRSLASRIDAVRERGESF